MSFTVLLKNKAPLPSTAPAEGSPFLQHAGGSLGARDNQITLPAPKPRAGTEQHPHPGPSYHSTPATAAPETSGTGEASPGEAGPGRAAAAPRVALHAPAIWLTRGSESAGERPPAGQGKRFKAALLPSGEPAVTARPQQAVGFRMGCGQHQRKRPLQPPGARHRCAPASAARGAGSTAQSRPRRRRHRPSPLMPRSCST